MNPNDDGYKILRDVQKKCHELNQKIDSMIRIMEVFTAYMQYSNKMADMDPLDVTQFMSEGSENMNPKDFQKIMNAAKNSDQPMSPHGTDGTAGKKLYDAVKQGSRPFPQRKESGCLRICLLPDTPVDLLRPYFGIYNFLAVIQAVVTGLHIADSHGKQKKRRSFITKHLKTDQKSRNGTVRHAAEYCCHPASSPQGRRKL